MAQAQVAVIMGVYNPDAGQLEQSVASILAQDYTDLTFYICDDGSHEKTWRQLKGYARADSRIRLLRHSENRGLAAALNSCLALADEPYIARQDADDISLPGRISCQAVYLQAHPDISFIGSSLQLINAGGRVWGARRFPPCPQPEDFLFSVPFQHGALMFRREALEQCGGYRVGRLTRRTEDYQLLMRMYAMGMRGENLPAPYYLFREDEAAQKRRKYRYRVDEAVIRMQGFSQMGLGWKGLIYAAKPLAVGLLPSGVRQKIKKRQYGLQAGQE